jgi:two-component system chemotaxis sensor kinase CheA
MDPDRIRDLAVARGLLIQEAGRGPGRPAGLDLIFLPGFSTAATVSDLSGRGVGMDVVRSAAARLGGRVEIAGTKGQGSTVRFVLPITMVLTKVMIVACGESATALPWTASSRRPA